MPINPLPQFEEDVKAYEEELAAYQRLKIPETIVVRFGFMMLVGEYPYKGDVVPGCGSKIVVRTHRGTEIGEMLTSTCANSGCGKSVTRKQMLEYIDNSGGRDYPFFTDGKALRVANKDDMDRQAKLEQSRHGFKMEARRIVEQLGLPMRIVDAEPILGGERLTFYFTSDDRIDFRDLVHELSESHRARIDLRQVGARDEARVAGDYERCGQYCCCKNFLKVLRPVSMKSAKIQKATLDPLKISGRCGRLMCCLRYEDETYTELRKKLPKKKVKVGTPDGDGIVIDTQILTQLVRVRLDDTNEDIAVTVEELTEPGLPRPKPEPVPIPEPQLRSEPRSRPGPDKDTDGGERTSKKRRRRKRRGKPSETAEGGQAPRPTQPEPKADGEGDQKKKRRRRRRRKRKPDGGGEG